MIPSDTLLIQLDPKLTQTRARRCLAHDCIFNGATDTAEPKCECTLKAIDIMSGGVCERYTPREPEPE